MSPTRSRRRKWTAGRRWIITGSKIAGLALIPKTWLSERSKLLKKVPNTIDSINEEAKCTRKTKEKLLGARQSKRASRQDISETGHA